MQSNSKREIKALCDITSKDVESLYAKYEKQLRQKIDDTRNAYLGFIFPMDRSDFKSVQTALGIDEATGRKLYRLGTDITSFKPNGVGPGTLTNHIVGSSILALRGRSLDTGLSSVTDDNLAELISEYEETIYEIANARRTWFGKIYFPAIAFSNALKVFGSKVSDDELFRVASIHGFGNFANDRKTIRGDFGIGVWLALLGNV